MKLKKTLSLFLSLVTVLSVGLTAVVGADNTEKLQLTENSRLTLDRESGYLMGIDGTVTVGELRAEFLNSNIFVFGKNDDDLVATDNLISCGSDSIKALIFGDVDRNGKINLADVILILKKTAGWDVDLPAKAADVDVDGSVTLLDAVKMLKAVAGWSDISLGNVRMVFENVKIPAEFEDSSLDLYFANTMLKRAYDNTENTGENSYNIKLARNETESCQMFLSSTESKTDVSIEISDFEYEYGGYTLEAKLEYELCKELALYDFEPETFVRGEFDYSDTNMNLYPEIIVPLSENYDLKADRTQMFLISVTTPKDAPAGIYKAVVNVRDGLGNIIKTANVYSKVWDFTLPDTPYSQSAFCLGDECASRNRDESLSHEDVMCQYYEFLLDHNLSAYELPFYPDDPRADKYMSDPRVTSFVISGASNIYGGHWYLPDHRLKSAYEKVMSNPEWAKKGYLYYTDEPTGGGLMAVKTAWEHNAQVLGTTDFRNMSPGGAGYANDYCTINIIDAIEFMKPYINIWCPNTEMFLPGASVGGRRAYLEYGPLPERYYAQRDEGDSLWWYVCIAPEMPMANFFCYYQGVNMRTVLWQQYMVDSDGLLYYATTYSWNHITKYKFELVDGGDGTLLYAGEMFGFKGPCASWRLIQIRDGFDDFDYMHMAEEIYGRDEVMKCVNQVTTAINSYSTDYRDIATQREILGDLLDGNYDK